MIHMHCTKGVSHRDPTVEPFACPPSMVLVQEGYDRPHGTPVDFSENSREIEPSGPAGHNNNHDRIESGMSPSQLKSMEQADALVFAVDLFSSKGAALTREMSRIETEVSSAWAFSKLLRLRYLIVVKNVASGTCQCLPCFDLEGLREGVDHAYRLASRSARNVGVLVMPDDLGPTVHAQAAITRAATHRGPVASARRPPRHG